MRKINIDNVETGDVVEHVDTHRSGVVMRTYRAEVLVDSADGLEYWPSGMSRVIRPVGSNAQV